MSPIRLLILAVAAVAAIGAALLMRTAMSRPEVLPPEVAAIVPQMERTPTVNVLVASGDKLRGDILTEEDLAWAEWPESALSPLFLNDRDMPDAMETMVGQAVRSPIYENEPILPQRLVMKGDTGYLAALVRPGMRAVAVEVSPESASGGFILPDDRVDVIVTYRVEIEAAMGSDEVTVTETILENVRVLAIDQFFRQEELAAAQVGQVATLELSPADAEIVSLASRSGEVSLTLRSFADAQTDGEEPRSVAKDFLATASPGRRGAGGVAVVRNGKTSYMAGGGGN